ncbi:hypothetical protein [Flavobacterium terrae]|uniref:Uncharacterized protein n=1 Tax=Flavobacterium terrae TaxID=415425 RepID=A0A1M6GP92_9FLAO|nr:hypothetical protein [Flavobacterium terrae]SHJ11791.1 hypothetical protein SAMN05444363_2717 [Flavobacterium terrae]
MKDFDNIMDVWKQQKEVKIPEAGAIIQKAKKERNSFTNKIILQATILLLTVVVLIWVGTAINFKMITTYIGLGLMFLCVFGFSMIRLYQMSKIKKIDFTQKPSLTLIELEKTYKFQQFVSNKVGLMYFILLNLAFVFYFIEVMQPMSLQLKSIVITAYISWMLFAYFYLGKKEKKKENERIQKMIDSIKEMEANYEK